MVSLTFHHHWNKPESGDREDHDLPGCGNIDWQRILTVLRNAPRLRNIQSEVLTARRDIPIRTVVESMLRLFGAAPERKMKNTN